MRKIVRIPGSTPYGFRLVGGDGDVVTVARVRKESKAEEAGLQEGDAVLAINDVGCQGLSYSSVFGLTELNEHELKLEILRGPDAQSNWRTALACLDTSVQKLSEEDVILLLRKNSKKDSGLFQPSKQQLFALQDPKPKFKQFSLPRIDVVFDSSDVPTNFVTTSSPRMTSSQVIRVVQSQEPSPLPLLTRTDFDQGRSFVSRTFQNFCENEKSGSDIICASSNEPITLQFKADAFKPFSLESTREEHMKTADKSPPNQPPRKYQSFDARNETPGSMTASGPTHRFASTSNIIVTNNSIKPFAKDEDRHWNKHMNFTQSREVKSPKVEHFFNSPVKKNFEDFSRAGTDFSGNFPSEQKFFDEPRNETFFDVAPTNILKKFNIGRINTSQKVDDNQEPCTVVPVIQNFNNSTSWTPVQASNFQEPFSLSTDFGHSSVGQAFPRFPDASLPETQRAPPPPPPIPTGGIPTHQTGSPNELNLTKYGGNLGLRESEKQLLKEKVKMAKDMAHSVLAPANKNSKGQRMFLKRRANSENWAIEGPDPMEKQRSDEGTSKSLTSPLKPFQSFNVNQTFKPLKPFYQAGSQLYSSPVQPVKWPFDSNATSQISLGYCDL